MEWEKVEKKEERRTMSDGKSEIKRNDIEFDKVEIKKGGESE